MRTWARFDDARAGRGLRFSPAQRELVAWRPAEVGPVLRELDRVTSAGNWAFGFVAYEAASGLDPALVTAPPSPDLPLVWFGITAVPPRRVASPPPGGAFTSGRWRCATSAAEHAAAVASIRSSIAAGEFYQCNLTTRLHAGFAGDPATLYAKLAQAQRGRFHAQLDCGRHVVLSASPELFVEVRGRTARMSPMKGTTARHSSPQADALAIASLRASPKEQAENVMIVDLVRNDLSRVGRTGSVVVEELCRVESYPTVHQLVSDVRVDLRDEVDLAALFAAIFPAGSVTGAPKARAMAAIRALEGSPRGVYCGAVGWIAPPAQSVRARFGVAIRTVSLDRATGTATYGAGGGITWSSEAAAEWRELQAKVRVLDLAAADPAEQPPMPTTEATTATAARV